MSMFDCDHCGDRHHVNDFCATGPMSAEPIAPTTRETADHAELARLADEMVGLLAPSQGERLLEYERHQLDVASRIQSLSRALLSEIAALRGDLTETRVAADLLVSSVRADLRQTERQRDELRKALEPFARAAEKLDGLWSDDDWRWNDSVRSGVTVRDIRRASQVLANQGADKL